MNCGVNDGHDIAGRVAFDSALVAGSTTLRIGLLAMWMAALLECGMLFGGGADGFTCVGLRCGWLLAWLIGARLGDCF